MRGTVPSTSCTNVYTTYKERQQVTSPHTLFGQRGGIAPSTSCKNVYTTCSTHLRFRACTLSPRTQTLNHKP